MNMEQQPYPTNETIVVPELLAKMQRYFDLLDKPEFGVSSEEAERIASEYYVTEIVGQYSAELINAALWMSR